MTDEKSDRAQVDEAVWATALSMTMSVTCQVNGFPANQLLDIHAGAMAIFLTEAGLSAEEVRETMETFGKSVAENFETYGKHKALHAASNTTEVGHG